MNEYAEKLENAKAALDKIAVNDKNRDSVTKLQSSYDGLIDLLKEGGKVDTLLGSTIEDFVNGVALLVAEQEKSSQDKSEVIIPVDDKIEEEGITRVETLDDAKAFLEQLKKENDPRDKEVIAGMEKCVKAIDELAKDYGQKFGGEFINKTQESFISITNAYNDRKISGLSEEQINKFAGAYNNISQAIIVSKENQQLYEANKESIKKLEPKAEKLRQDVNTLQGVLKQFTQKVVNRFDVFIGSIFKEIKEFFSGNKSKSVQPVVKSKQNSINNADVKGKKTSFIEKKLSEHNKNPDKSVSQRPLAISKADSFEKF